MRYFIFFLVIGLGVAFTSKPLNKKPRITKPMKGIAIVDELDIEKDVASVFYIVNDDFQYGKVKTHFHSATIGSAYEMIYDSVTYQSEVYECKPVFLPNKDLVTTKGTILSVSNDIVNYSLTVPHLGQLERSQFICPDTLIKYKNVLKNGHAFEVKYVRINPENAILYFDKPIKL